MIAAPQIAEWFDAHAPALLLLARQWLGDRAAAEDVVQDVFVALIDQPRPPGHPRAWLFKAVRNAAVSHARAHGRRAAREHRLAEARPDWFEPRHDDRIDAADAQRALGILPPDQREVIVLRIWAQMTLTEIAQITGDPISTLFTRYRTGLARLKHLMEPSCPTTTKQTS